MAHCPPEGAKCLLRQRRNLNEAPDHAWRGQAQINQKKT